MVVFAKLLKEKENGKQQGVVSLMIKAKVLNRVISFNNSPQHNLIFLLTSRSSLSFCHHSSPCKQSQLESLLKSGKKMETSLVSCN